MIRTASYSDIGGRERNEDHCKQILGGSKGICMVLADGLGGHGNGELASEMACRTICEHWNGRVDQESVIALVKEAHKQVLALHNRYYSMKTTVVALLSDQETAAWAHVGDSRLYHFYNKKLVFQTKDHSASQIAVMLEILLPIRSVSTKIAARSTVRWGRRVTSRSKPEKSLCSPVITHSCSAATASGNTFWKRKWKRT